MLRKRTTRFYRPQFPCAATANYPLVSWKDQALVSSGNFIVVPCWVHTADHDSSSIDTIEVSEVDVSLLGHGYFAEARRSSARHLYPIREGGPPPRFGLQPSQTDDG